MLKSDSPKEEGEISDEDDMVVGVSALVPNMGDSVIILPGPQHARDIPCHAPKVANKTSKQRQKRKSKQRKPVVTYNKETYHTIKVPDTDYCLMIKEYEDARRRSKLQNIDESVLENEIKSSTKVSGNQDIYDSAEDEELLRLRMTALKSAEKRLDSKVDNIQYPDTFSSQDSNVDNYDVVHMEMDSDADDNNNLETDSQNIDFLQEHIQHLKQQKQELIESQKRIEHQQNMLSEVTPDRGISIPPLMTQGPLFSIIQHNLHSSTTVRPLLSLSCSLPAPTPAAVVRAPLLPEPKLRGPLLPKPALLPIPKQPLLMPEHSLQRLSIRQPLLAPKPLMSLSFGNVHSGYSNNPRPTALQSVAHWSSHACYSPRPIEVIGAGCRNVPLLPSPPFNSDLKSVSYSTTTNITSSTGSSTIGMSNKASPRFQMNEDASKDPLYEDFEDEMQVIRDDLKSCSTSLININETPTPASSPSPSWLLSLPQYEGLTTNNKDFEERNNSDFESAEIVQKVEVKDDDESYLNHLKNKLLLDIELRKTMTHKVMSENVMKNSNKSINQNHSLPDCNPTRSQKKLDEEEEDFFDMIVIDSDHESSSPTKNFDHSYQETFYNEDVKPDISSQLVQQCLVIAPSFDEEPSERLDGECLTPSDESKDEEMILRARLLKSFAARKIKQEQLKQETMNSQPKDEKKELVLQSFYQQRFGEDFDESKNHQKLLINIKSEVPVPSVKRSLKRKKRRNRKRKNNVTGHAALPTTKQKISFRPQTFSKRRNASIPNATKFVPPPQTHSSSTSTAIPAATHGQTSQSQIDRTVFNILPKQPASTSAVNVKLPASVMKFAVSTSDTKLQEPSAEPRVKVETKKESSNSAGVAVSSRPSTAVSSAFQNRPFKASGDDVRTSNVKIQSSRTKVEGHRGGSRQPVRAPARRTDSRLVQTISNKYSKFPNCEPIVIYLNGDESEESDKEEDGSENTETGDMDICNRLESLLKEARKEVTPACSGRSPEDDLVTSVARETKTETRPLSSLENNKTTTNRDITTTITNSGIALKKTVVQHALKKDKLENLNKEELMKREKELEVSLLTHKLKQLEDKSSKESKSLKEEKVRLLKLESVLSKRRAELVTTEANAQKIREQLEAVLKILNHNQLQVAELDKKREALRSHILEKERKTLRTSNDITECQEKLLTVTKSIKSNIQEHHNKQTTSLMQQTNSNATKSKQQSRHKRKLSTATNDPDLPPAKRWAVVSTLPVTLDSVTTGGTSASTSTVAKTLERTSGEVTTRTKSSSGESRVSTEISKSILKSKNSASLQQKSSSRKVKLPPQNTKDEKFLKIKDAHRKSTLRNHQPMQTTTTQLRLSVFSQAQKLLNFNVGLVQRGDSSPKLNSLKRKSFDEAEENVSSRMSGLLRSIKSFRTENEFSSSTFTNKLDNNVPLCQFELLGKCNDDNCPWQHERDYSMTTKEVLMEIASYHPSVVPSIDAKTPPSKYKALVGAYVDDFMTRSKQTDAKKLYLMMLHLVSQAKGSAIFTPLDQDRLWSVRQDKNPGKVKDSRVLNEDQEEQNANSNMLAPDLGPQLDEDGSSTLDRRYWTTSRASSREAADKNRNASHDDGGSDGDADGSTAQDHKRVASLHEEAFLKKAMSIIGEETKSKFPSKLDTALKVLAKGIEHHPHSQNLWQHYLRMFVQKRNREAKRGSPTIISNPPQMDSTGPKSEHDSTNNCNNNNNNNDDVSDQLRVAFVNALEMVPSYDLHWQFIRVSESFSDKMEACNLALHYLCSDQVNSLEEDAISHWLLEVILHQAQICFHTGKNTMGMDLIEDCLNAQDVYGLMSRMTTSDRVILWMSFLHLSIFHFAPSCLFSRTNDNAGMIVSKTPFTIINHHLSLSAKQLTNNDNDCSEMVSWYDKAIAECLTYFFESPPKDLAATGEEDGRSFAVGPTVTPQSDWEAWAWLSRVIISKANLLVEFKRYEDAISFLSSMSKLMPEVHDIRISLLHVTGDIASCTDDKSIRGHEIFASNVEYAHGCFSAKLTYHVAKLLVSKDQSEEALQLLERLPIRIHDSNSGKEDPNILYCKLLDLELPAGFIPPSYSKGFTKESIENERVHFWLCYCLLLDLQGDYDSMEDAYSRAVCRQRNAADLGEIWLARLDRLVCSSGSLATDEIQSEFFGLVEKSLSSMPVRLLLPLSEIGGKTYDSYDVHNNIIAFCVQRMASLESLTSFYDWTLSMMPGNSQLAVEAINHFTRNKCRSLTKGFILICLQEAPRCLALWKTSLKLAMLEGNTDQMRTEYKKALEYLPYQKKLWKDFMLFEMVNRREEAVDRIVGRCQQLGVNIVDLYKSLSAR